MERVGYIYKYTFPNGKIYIGQTARNIKARFAEHCYSARKKDGYYLHNAIAKYGKDNIKIEIVETITDLNTLSLREQLNEKEIFYINYFNSLIPNGYNTVQGGNSNLGFKHREESKLAISKANTGHIVTQKTRELISQRLKGHIVSEETKRNISKAKKESTYVPSEETRKLLSSKRKGVKFTKEHKEKISKALKGRVFTKETIEKIKEKLTHSILQFNKENILISEYKNINEASKASNTTVSNIYKCLCGKNKTANGYIWKYKNK